MDVFDWIYAELNPERCTTDQLLYEHMASQSGYSLPVIYQPFDPNDKGHWRDRGAALDFVSATKSRGGRVLDFGPGDGWPSLIIAPWVSEVVGVDGAQRRVAVCRANAERMGLTNTAFHYVAPGDPLPFDNASFDAVVGASSVEQTPDPRATLLEFYRVLRSGGRVRLSYEALGRYRGGEEREAWFWPADDATTRLVLYDRHIEEEYAVQVSITYALPGSRIVDTFGAGESAFGIGAITVQGLEALKGAVVGAKMSTTIHPSGATFSRWLTEIGFRQVLPSHDGIRFAGAVFDRLPSEARPATMDAIDAYLAPLVEVVVDMLAPVEMDPTITAVK